MVRDAAEIAVPRRFFYLSSAAFRRWWAMRAGRVFAPRVRVEQKVKLCSFHRRKGENGRYILDKALWLVYDE